MSQKGTRWVVVTAVVTMLGVAITATALARSRAGDARPASDQAIPAALASPGPNDLPGSIDLNDPVDLDGMAEPRDRVVSPASDPRGAVEGFLAAEQAGDLARSYQFLSAGDREQIASAQDWIAAHADLVPPIIDYEIDGSASDTVIASTLRLESSLDEVIGLVPARALMRWRVVEAPSGRWSIDLARSELEPQLPSDDGAVAAATRWAQARQRCASGKIPAHRLASAARLGRGPHPGEWEGGLVGFPGLADALCDRTGEVVVGRVQPLGDLDVEPFVTAFGDDAVTWARVVPVRATTQSRSASGPAGGDLTERPASLRAVLAPVDDRWVVIGVLDTEL